MEEKNARDALVQLALDSAKENKEHAKRWFLGFIISNAIWAVVVLVIVLSFLWFESQYEYSMETTETTITQESGENGNNIYQSGDHATYNEGGEMNGEADNQDEDNEENENESDG